MSSEPPLMFERRATAVARASSFLSLARSVGDQRSFSAAAAISTARLLIAKTSANATHRRRRRRRRRRCRCRRCHNAAARRRPAALAAARRPQLTLSTFAACCRPAGWLPCRATARSLVQRDVSLVVAWRAVFLRRQLCMWTLA